MAIEHVTGDAMFSDVLECVLDNGVMLGGLDHSIDEDDGDDGGDGSSGTPAVLAIALEPRRPPSSPPERTRHKPR